MDLLLVAGLILAAGYAWVMGANDMANVVAAVVGSRTLKYRVTTAIFAVSVLAGALAQGYMVMKTLGYGIVKELNIFGAVVVSISAITWIAVATALGLPVSTSQSITSGVLGVGLASILMTNDWGLVNFSVVYKIVASWVISPAMTIPLATLLYLVFDLLHRRGLICERTARGVAAGLVSFSGYSFGANDVANATGIYLAVTGSYLMASGLDSQILLALYGAAFIALGGIISGRRVVETMGYKITRLDTTSALSSSLATALSVWVFTTVPYMLTGYGMPISTTYTSVSSIIGVGIAKNKSVKRGINLKVVSMILTSWVLTLPVVSLISACLYYAITAVLMGG